MQSLAELVARVRNYEPVEGQWIAKEARPINMLMTDGGHSSTVAASQILHHLRAAALQYGEDRLGFPISKIGTTRFGREQRRQCSSQEYQKRRYS